MNSQLTYFQICYVRDHYQTESVKGMARHLQVPILWIKDLMKRSGWIVTKEMMYAKRAAKLRQVSTSTPEIDCYLQLNYLRVPVKTMAKAIGRSNSFVRTRMRQLGLVVPPEIIAQRIKDSQLKKGNTPPNKGRRMEEFMSPEVVIKFRANQFVKGQLPHNTAQADGEIRIRNMSNGCRYKMIRLGLGKWVLLHKHLWESIHGPVPPGMCLWAKDRNSLNENPDNWELITRKENIRRNGGSKDLSDNYVLGCIAPKDTEAKSYIRENLPDLIELKRTQLNLSRNLKKHGQKQNL